MTSENNIEYTKISLRKALEEDNPRIVFLLGQLYLEMYIDKIIVLVFSSNFNITNVLNQTLDSENFTYKMKINLLKDIFKEIIKNCSDNSHLKSFLLKHRKSILNDMEIIGNIRNAFQHNLYYSKAISKLNNNTGKFFNLKTKLKDYRTLPPLLMDFKKIVIPLQDSLIYILISLMELASDGTKLKSFGKMPAVSKQDAQQETIC